MAALIAVENQTVNKTPIRFTSFSFVDIIGPNSPLLLLFHLLPYFT
jgi:hypothetical protein